MAVRNEGELLAITIAGYAFDRVQGLGSAIPVDGCDAQFQKAAIGDMNSHVFGGPQEWEVTEIGLMPYLLSWIKSV